MHFHVILAATYWMELRDLEIPGKGFWRSQGNGTEGTRVAVVKKR